jgi:hypothetical protein
MEHTSLVNTAGAAIGFVFGFVGQRSGFCLTRALRGWWVTGEGAKIRAFALALAVAIIGTQAIEAAGLIDLRRSLYAQPQFSWVLLSAGGALFGYGMVAANGCGARALVLLASGNLRSFVVLVCLGVSAFAILTGVLAPPRLWLAAATSVTLPLSPPTAGGALAAAGVSAAATRTVTAALPALGLAAFALLHGPFRRSAWEVASGLVIGALVPLGWLATGWLGADDFDPVPVASLTFVAPIGDSIQYLMLATGVPLGFGVAVVAGVLAGAFLAAAVSQTWALEGFYSPRRMLRSMAGGALMGIGGALALGCSIGQGLTGLSTLALPSFIAAGGILLGARLALRGPLALPLL